MVNDNNWMYFDATPGEGEPEKVSLEKVSLEKVSLATYEMGGRALKQ